MSYQNNLNLLDFFNNYLNNHTKIIFEWLIVFFFSFYAESIKVLNRNLHLYSDLLIEEIKFNYTFVRVNLY